MINNRFSREISVFHGRNTPEVGRLVGYGAIIDALHLSMPMPRELSIISTKNKKYKTDKWQVFSNRYQPQDDLYGQLVFAIKYEGINLLFFKKLFEQIAQEEITDVIQNVPTGQYARKIWFLYEWLMQEKLPIDDLEQGNYVNLVDTKIQFGLNASDKSSRHRINNNLIGTQEFCPMVFKTDKIQQLIGRNLIEENNNYIEGIGKQLLKRASAFLLLKDSKASFSIEGENPKNQRTARWGRAIGQAGLRDLSHEELERLQQIVIGNTRFIKLGYRTKGGFIGDRDRDTFTPLPDHISAKESDIKSLMQGLLDADKLVMKNEVDPIVGASLIAFGFVFIHPFVDGNGRIHRYLIHHVLAQKEFSQQGIIFPISASILDRISEYRKVLESYSLPLLDFIEWKETNDHNVEVTNETIDYYRYYDATLQTEFLYECVEDTIENIIPSEISYLQKYEEFKSYIDSNFEMPDDMVSLLLRFLEQNRGQLSNRAKEQEFKTLTSSEVLEIEKQFDTIFI